MIGGYIIGGYIISGYIISGYILLVGTYNFISRYTCILVSI